MALQPDWPGAALIGLSGGIVAAAMGDAINGLSVMAALSGTISGRSTIHFFGRPGRDGPLFACVGAVLATLGGAALAGALLGLMTFSPLLVFLGLWVGPITVILALAENWQLFTLWCGLMTLVHLVLRAWRSDVAAPLR